MAPSPFIRSDGYSYLVRKVSECSNSYSPQIAKETHKQMETLTIDHSRTAEAWQSVPPDGQSEGDEGSINATESCTI